MCAILPCNRQEAVISRKEQYMKAEDIKIRDSFTGKEVYRCATFAHPITGKRQYVYGRTDAEVLAKLKVLYEKAEEQAYNNKPSDKSFSSYLTYSLRLTVLDERKNGNKRLTIKGTQKYLDRLYKGSLVDISDMERIKEEDIIKTLEIARDFETKKEYGEFAERIFKRAFTLAKENGLNVVDDPKVFARKRLDPNRHRKEFCIYSPVEYDVIKKEMEKELSEKITGSLMCAYFSLMTGIEPEILADIKSSDVTDAGLFVKNSLYGDHLIRYGNDMMKEFAIQLRGGY